MKVSEFLAAICLSENVHVYPVGLDEKDEKDFGFMLTYVGKLEQMPYGTYAIFSDLEIFDGVSLDSENNCFDIPYEIPDGFIERNGEKKGV